MHDKRASLITKVIEYVIEIKVIKIVRGTWLCEQLDGNIDNIKQVKKKVVLVLNNEDKDVVATTPSSWIQEMMCYLQIGECP